VKHFKQWFDHGWVIKCRQSNVAADYEKGASHQDRKAKEVQEVGHTNDRNEEAAPPPSAQLSFDAWIKDATWEISANPAPTSEPGVRHNLH